MRQNRNWLKGIYAPSKIHVKITGKVRNPGIYEMVPGDQVKHLVEKAIANFVEKRAYAIGSPMFSRESIGNVMTASAFAAFKTAMRTKFTDSELSRIFFQAGGARFEMQEFERNSIKRRLSIS